MLGRWGRRPIQLDLRTRLKNNLGYVLSDVGWLLTALRPLAAPYAAKLEFLALLDPSVDPPAAGWPQDVGVTHRLLLFTRPFTRGARLELERLNTHLRIPLTITITLTNTITARDTASGICRHRSRNLLPQGT